MSEDDRNARNAENLARATAGDENAVEALIRDNYSLVVSVAKKFTGRGCETDDLIQIGLMGMLKAIRSFDTSRGFAFSTYAVPMIMGEIRKFLRDDGLIKYGRVRKQNGYAVMRAKELYASKNGKEAKIADIEDMTGLSSEEISEALDAVTPVASLSGTVGDTDELTFENTLAASENPFESEIEKMALYESLRSLDVTWRKIIILRYFRCLSQQETAKRLGMTQVKISREEKKIFAYMRRQLEG